jgi:hypothetical protein
LDTNRYEHVIYSTNFGSELANLIGKPTSYVVPELQRLITEALTVDNRVTSVDGFSFDVKGNNVTTSFTVHTIYGDIQEVAGIGQ